MRGDDSGYQKPLQHGRSANRYACDLVRQICAMNRGRYLEQDLLDAEPSNFCIGVGGYPEKHFEAPNLQLDVRHVKEKVDAGAHYVVTQMFFDNRHYFRFVELCRAAGIKVPIIPGLKILSSRNAARLDPAQLLRRDPGGARRRGARRPSPTTSSTSASSGRSSRSRSSSPTACRRSTSTSCRAPRRSAACSPASSSAL